MNRLPVAIIIFLVAMSPVCSMGQNRQSGKQGGEDWWINLPSSPLVFEANVSGRMLNLFNQGSKSIKRYRLGCVVEENGKLKISHKMAVAKTNLAPNKGLLNMTYVYADDKSRCERDRAKLSVIEVTFSGGSQWKAK